MSLRHLGQCSQAQFCWSFNEWKYKHISVQWYCVPNNESVMQAAARRKAQINDPSWAALRTPAKCSEILVQLGFGASVWESFGIPYIEYLYLIENLYIII